MTVHPVSHPIPTRELVCGFDRPNGGWLETRGRLVGPEAGPAVIVLGGISATRRLIADETGQGWWPGVAAPGGALDPTRQRLLSFDFLGEEAAPFPTLGDQAAAVLALADAAGLDRFSLVGASYGGVICLEIAVRAPERVLRLDILCAAARPSPAATAWRSIQRDTVELGLACGRGEDGLNLARRLAMTTYRTRSEFNARFTNPTPDSRDKDGVEAYLQARGAAFTHIMTPQRFLALSRSMDSADIAVDRITAPTRFFAVQSDQLVTPEDITSTAQRMSQAETVAIESLYGHDGFLKEIKASNAFLRGPL